MLRPKPIDAALPGDAIIEQEYQKRTKVHGITIRPDMIIDVPFKGGAGQDRDEGNFVAIEIKRKSADVQQAFDSLRRITEACFGGYSTSGLWLGLTICAFPEKCALKTKSPRFVSEAQKKSRAIDSPRYMTVPFPAPCHMNVAGVG